MKYLVKTLSNHLLCETDSKEDAIKKAMILFHTFTRGGYFIVTVTDTGTTFVEKYVGDKKVTLTE